MRNTGKKLVSLLATVACLTTAFSFAGCSEKAYKGTKLDGDISGEISSNGGFAVEKGDYVYFINGATSNTDDNTYGKVEKGSLMRIKKTDLAEGNNNAQTVVPALFVAQDFNSGVYIYGDSVYFATPTTSKNSKGEIQNSMLDFKSAKLDGSEMMKDEYFRLESNSANYRFVEVEGTVYCLYEEDGALKSFNTSSKTSTTLVKGGTYVYDSKDLSNPNVYYTMGVTYGVDTKNPTTAGYNQLYVVNAAATATVNADEASYTVNGKTYDFDEKFLKEKNSEAKKGEEPYDLSDYSTYPYVNLGTLVLDGVGLNGTEDIERDDRFNWNKNDGALELDGYTYTVSSYQNGGVYFTRESKNKTNSDTENATLYFLEDALVTGGWNAVTGNEKKNLDVVAYNTTNASASAIYLREGDLHTYFYVANETLYRENNQGEKIRMSVGVGTPTLYKVDGEYLYYFATGTNGNNLSRIKCVGEEKDYNDILKEEEYQASTLAIVDWNSSWYKPEIFGDTVLYSNAQTFGESAYNYVYKASFKDVKASNEAYDDVQEYITKDTNDSSTQTAMQFYFRNPTQASIDTVREIYAENTSLLEKFNAFVKEVEAKTYKTEDAFIQLLGTQTDKDAEAIKEAFENSMKPATEEEETEKKGLPTWAIVLIVVGSVLVVAGATTATLIILKKKKAKKAEEDATVNAYKRTKIDTTDDKTIDVYATDDEAEDANVVEETKEVETAEEETVEEATEEVVEEATEEVVSEVEEEQKDE